MRLVELIDHAVHYQRITPAIPVLATARGVDRLARWVPPRYAVSAV